MTTRGRERHVRNDCTAEVPKHVVVKKRALTILAEMFAECRQVGENNTWSKVTQTYSNDDDADDENAENDENDENST